MSVLSLIWGLKNEVCVFQIDSQINSGFQGYETLWSSLPL